jgi:hypothetical protein
VRPTAIAAALLTFVTSIWSAVATSFHSLEAARIICCFATSCGEVLPAIVVRDIFFLHERGSSMGLYMIFFQALPSLGNVLAGFCIQGAGWRWWLWVTSSSFQFPELMLQVLTIVTGFTLVLTFFGLPETQYPRASAAQAPIEPTSSEDIIAPSPKDETSVEETNEFPLKKSYLQQLKPWSGINPNGHKAGFLWLFIRPWLLILYPAVAYSTLVFGFAIGSLLMVVATSTEVFQSPPYNFGPGVQCLMYLFSVFGALIGAIFGGYGTDVLTKYLSAKNNGIFEPENRLIMLIGPLLIGPSGVLMYPSLTSQRQ